MVATFLFYVVMNEKRWLRFKKNMRPLNNYQANIFLPTQQYSGTLWALHPRHKCVSYLYLNRGSFSICHFSITNFWFWSYNHFTCLHLQWKGHSHSDFKVSQLQFKYLSEPVVCRRRQSSEGCCLKVIFSSHFTCICATRSTFCHPIILFFKWNINHIYLLSASWIIWSAVIVCPCNLSYCPECPSSAHFTTELSRVFLAKVFPSYFKCSGLKNSVAQCRRCEVATEFCKKQTNKKKIKQFCQFCLFPVTEWEQNANQILVTCPFHCTLCIPMVIISILY